MSNPTWLICALLVASTTAQKAAPVISIGSPPFTETRSKVVKTSGGEILGFVSADLQAPTTGREILVSGLQPADKTICVSIRHVGGAYSAHFTVSKTVSGPTVRFALPRNSIADLKAKQGELAILARGSSASVCSKADPILPASWGEARNFGLVALVNDHQALRSQVVRRGLAPVRCKNLSEALSQQIALTAYQVACPVDEARQCNDAILSIQFIDGMAQSTLRTPIRRPC